MAASMTAFARVEEETEFGTMAWELRSVNHRYLEMNLRLPEELRALESGVRECVAARFGRGKIDCTFRFKPSAAAGLSLTLNEELVAQIGKLVNKVSATVHVSGGLSVGDVLRWPGVVQSAETNHDAIQTRALALLNSTLLDLQRTREREGDKLKSVILSRTSQLLALVGEAKTRLPEIVSQYRGKLVDRLADLKEGGDPQRLELELVMIAQKIDIAEELDRLAAHVGEVQRVLEQKGPVGRRLDFLMQELNRESNTLGSKSIDVETTRCSVDMKVLIEQMREQIQNIE